MVAPYYWNKTDGWFPIQTGKPVLITQDEFEECCCGLCVPCEVVLESGTVECCGSLWLLAEVIAEWTADWDLGAGEGIMSCAYHRSAGRVVALKARAGGYSGLFDVDLFDDGGEPFWTVDVNAPIYAGGVGACEQDPLEDCWMPPGVTLATFVAETKSFLVQEYQSGVGCVLGDGQIDFSTVEPCWVPTLYWNPQAEQTYWEQAYPTYTAQTGYAVGDRRFYVDGFTEYYLLCHTAYDAEDESPLEEPSNWTVEGEWDINWAVGPPGALWEEKEYAVGDIAYIEPDPPTDQDQFYICVTAHLGVNPPDSANPASDEWAADTNYDLEDEVYYDGTEYRCQVAHYSGDPVDPCTNGPVRYPSDMDCVKPE
jgi:hypothetical protein